MKKRNSILSPRVDSLRVALVLLLSAGAALACSNDVATQLGSGNSFALLALNNGSMIINSSTSITGDVGYSANVTSQTNQKVQSFTGTAYVDSTAVFNYMPATFQPTGGIVVGPNIADPLLDAAQVDVGNAAACYAALALGPGTSLGNVTTSHVLYTTSPVNVYTVTSLNLNGQTLTLYGGSTDLFVFIVQGSFDWSQSQMILNGVSPNQVVFYFPNASDVTINKSSTVFQGTILGPSASVDYHNPAQFVGAIIAKNIDVHSDFNILKPVVTPVGVPQ